MSVSKLQNVRIFADSQIHFFYNEKVKATFSARKSCSMDAYQENNLKNERH